MNRRMLQTALVSGAFGVVAIAGFAVAQPATPGQTLAEQEARAEQDPALEVEALVTPGAGDAGTDAADDTGSVDVSAEETDRDDDVAEDTDSVDDTPDDTESPDDTDSVEVDTADTDDSVDGPDDVADDADSDDDEDDGSDEDDSLDSDDS